MTAPAPNTHHHTGTPATPPHSGILTPPAAGLDIWFLPGPGPGALPALLDAPGLNSAERHRATAYRNRTAGALYAASHLALRHILSAHLGTTPAEVTFVREPCPACGAPHGRPALAPPDTEGLHFSLAHSHGMALIAVATTTVGVDIQHLPGPDTTVAVAPLLHPDERTELATAHPGALGQIWARKEAYLKAVGTGLAHGAATSYLGTHPAGWPTGWTITDLRCGPTHRAAAVLAGPPPTRSRTWRLGPTAPAPDSSQGE